MGESEIILYTTPQGNVKIEWDNEVATIRKKRIVQTRDYKHPILIIAITNIFN